MSIYAEIFLGGAALVFSGLLVRYTQKVAQYTKEYTGETRRLWEVTKKSYFATAAADYMFKKYYDRIQKWPSIKPAWTAFLDWEFPPPEEEKPKVFKSCCGRVILEALFPIEVETMEKVGMGMLEKLGFGFKRRKSKPKK